MIFLNRVIQSRKTNPDQNPSEDTNPLRPLKGPHRKCRFVRVLQPFVPPLSTWNQKDPHCFDVACGSTLKKAVVFRHFSSPRSLPIKWLSPRPENNSIFQTKGKSNCSAFIMFLGHWGRAWCWRNGKHDHSKREGNSCTWRESSG